MTSKRKRFVTAVAENMGSEDRLEYSVIGDTVNLASRITSAAPANKVWVGGTTYERIKGQISAKQIENVIVKSNKLSLTVYEITALKGDAIS